MGRNILQIVLSTDATERFWSRVDKKSDDECWEWLAGKIERGYGRISIKNKTFYAHRVSWAIHNGEIPEHDSWHGMCVCHTCDNPGCVNPHHLFLGTMCDNIQDRDKKGRRVPPDTAGEKHGSHKLTEEQVKEIREKYIPYIYTTPMLAKEYGVYKATIQRIVTHKSWTHVD